MRWTVVAVVVADAVT